MDMPLKIVSTNEFKFTATGNLKISKKFYASGQHQIMLTSMNVVEENVILRGDLGKINIGESSILDVGCIIRPSLNSVFPPFEYKNQRIGKYCYIGKNTIICSLSIGDFTYVGNDCIIVKKYFYLV